MTVTGRARDDLRFTSRRSSWRAMISPRSATLGDVMDELVGTDGWVRVDRLAGRVRIVLGGEVDASMEDALEQAVSEARASGTPVEIDVHSVTFMDSLALTVLARFAAAHDSAVFIDPPDIVRFLLDVTRFGEVVEIRSTGTRASRRDGASRTLDE